MTAQSKRAMPLSRKYALVYYMYTIYIIRSKLTKVFVTPPSLSLDNYEHATSAIKANEAVSKSKALKCWLLDPCRYIILVPPILICETLISIAYLQKFLMCAVIFVLIGVVENRQPSVRLFNQGSRTIGGNIEDFVVVSSFPPHCFFNSSFSFTYARSVENTFRGHPLNFPTSGLQALNTALSTVSFSPLPRSKSN